MKPLSPRFIPYIYPVLAALLLATGCSPKASDTTTQTTSASSNSVPVAEPARTVFDQDVPTTPNPKLPTIRLFVGAQELKTELALNELQIRTGMMFRSGIAEDEAMLFVFPVPHQVGFWMKNVSIELSCAYIDSEGVILEIHDMEPQEVRPIQSASDRVQYVLETSRGWFQRHGIQPGTLIRTERGTLRETFFQRRPQ